MKITADSIQEFEYLNNFFKGIPKEFTHHFTVSGNMNINRVVVIDVSMIPMEITVFGRFYDMVNQTLPDKSVEYEIRTNNDAGLTFLYKWTVSAGRSVKFKCVPFPATK